MDIRRHGLLAASALVLGSLLSTGAAAQQTGDDAVPTDEAGTGGDIIVTAQKRSERLLDVPVPVAVIKAEDLTSTGKSRIQDYFTTVPGVSVADMVGGTPSIVIRGITTGGFGNPTVGTTIDDVPVGFSTGTGGGYQAIDLDPSDVQSLEILRGPQGTLYGASSLGGLIRYVTRSPSTSDASIRYGGTLFGVAGGEAGGSLRGSVNLPVGDDLAVSASGYWRADAGYIDDSVRGLSNINDGHAYGGRFALNWQASDNFSIKSNFIHQESFKNASDDVLGPDLDELEAAPTFIPGSAGNRSRITFADLVADLQLGNVDLTSVTGYTESRNKLYLNLYSLSATANAVFNVSGVPYLYDTRGDKFSQELRASVDIVDSVNLLVGGFYTKENSKTNEVISAGNYLTGEKVGLLLNSYYPTTYREYAVFGDLTFTLSPRFEVQLGARESFIRQTYSNVKEGPLAGAPIPLTVTQDKAFTYLVTPKFRVTHNIMIYARAASGYRPGGPNFNAQLAGLPDTFEPDTTRNYDVGIKGQTSGGLLTFDASLYHIDWKNVQVRVTFPGGASVTNAGGARSRGAELSLTLAPATGLTISAWGAYNDAELTKDLPPLSSAKANAGDRLPYSSRYSGNISIDQKFPVGGNVEASVGASADFVGTRFSDFTPTMVRTELPAYTKFDLRAGVSTDGLSVDLFVNNLTDKRGVISKAYASPAFHIISPRTIGISLQASF